MNPIKYHRIYHLPWSETTTSDDVILTYEDLKHFENKNIVITIKMDGENTSLYSDYYHARSIDSKYHKSRNYVKQLHGNIKHLIPQDWRICGENLYAKHSIHYENLESYFMVFSIWNDKNICLSYSETIEWCELLNLKHVPIIEICQFNINKLKIICNNLDKNINEGIVIKNINEYHYNDFKHNIAKFVRKNHVNTSDHWMFSKIIKNNLKKQI